MNLHENIKVKTKRREWDIEVKKTDTLLYFNDKDGKSIGFIVNPDGQKFTVYQNGYKIDGKKFPTLKGSYGYMMAEEQVTIFLEWVKNIQNIHRTRSPAKR